MAKLILASVAGLVVGFIFLAGSVALIPNSPQIWGISFMVGVTLTLARIMRPKTVVRPEPRASERDNEADELDELERDLKAESARDAERPVDEDDHRSEREAHRRLVRDALAKEPRNSSSLWFVLLGAWFLYDMVKSSKDLTIAFVIIGVLLAHEAGHFIGMKVFGYRDVKMFFIPGFGAMTAGKPEGAPRWKEGVVLLLGPMPGIIVGGALLLQAPLPPLTAQIAVMLVLINGINLLPLGVLDGGKLVHLVLFSRRRALEVPFLLCANLGLIGVAFYLKAWLLGAVGLLGIMTAKRTAQLGALADQVRERHGALPPLAELDDRELDDVYNAARSSFPASPPPPLENVAITMRTVHEAARAEPVTAQQSTLLLVSYVTGVTIAVSCGLVLLSRWPK